MSNASQGSTFAAMSSSARTPADFPTDASQPVGRMCCSKGQVFKVVALVVLSASALAVAAAALSFFGVFSAGAFAFPLMIAGMAGAGVLTLSAVGAGVSCLRNRLTEQAADQVAEQAADWATDPTGIPPKYTYQTRHVAQTAAAMQLVNEAYSY